MMKRGFIFCVFTLWLLNSFIAQTGDNKLDSLLTSTKTQFNNSEKVLAYQSALILNSKSKEVGNKIGQAYAYYFFAMIDEDFGDKSKALENFELAKKFANQSGDELVILRVLTALSNYYMNIANIDKCVEICQEGIEKALAIKRLDIASSFYNNLSLAHWHINEYEQALIYVDKSIELKLLIDNEKILAHSYVNKGLLLTEMNRHFEGIEYYSKAEDIYLKDDTYYALTQVYINFTDVYIQLKNFEKARMYLSKALFFAEKSQDKTREAAVWNMLGTYYKEINQKDSTIYALEKGLHLSKVSDNKRNILKAYEELATFYKETNNTPKALMFLYEAYSLKDTVYNDSKTQSTQHLTIKYETEKKEAAIAKQALQLAEKDKSITQKNSWIISMVLLIIILMIIGYVFYNRKQVEAKQLATQQINNAIFESEQKERIRIARDLHDSIGQKLSVMKMLLSSEDEGNLKKAVSFLDETTEEVRAISHNLVPEILNLGLTKALENLAEQLNQSNKIKVNLNITPMLTKLQLAKQTEVSLYRIIQEIISNIIKHAKTDSILINVATKENFLQINIQDNGIGVDVKAIEASSGLGWKNIFARIKLINGELKIQSEKQKGSNFYINIPIT